MGHDEAVLLGKMKQAIDDLTKSVDKLEGTLENLDVKIEKSQEKQDRRIGIIENKQSKQRGFFIAISLIFPIITGTILLMMKN